MSKRYDSINEMEKAANCLLSLAAVNDCSKDITNEAKKIANQIRKMIEEGFLVGYSIFADEVRCLASTMEKMQYYSPMIDQAFTHAKRIQDQEIESITPNQTNF